MHSYSSFLAQIRLRPYDDDLRLIFADWLDENANPKNLYSERANLIRTQIFLDRIQDPSYIFNSQDSDSRKLFEKVVRLIARDETSGMEDAIETLISDFIQNKLSPLENLREREKNLLKKHTVRFLREDTTNTLILPFTLQAPDIIRILGTHVPTMQEKGIGMTQFFGGGFDHGFITEIHIPLDRQSFCSRGLENLLSKDTPVANLVFRPYSETGNGTNAYTTIQEPDGSLRHPLLREILANATNSLIDINAEQLAKWGGAITFVDIHLTRQSAVDLLDIRCMPGLRTLNLTRCTVDSPETMRSLVKSPAMANTYIISSSRIALNGVRGETKRGSFLDNIMMNRHNREVAVKRGEVFGLEERGR